MPHLTLSMIVKNEEKHLSGCFDSVKGLVDEIILTDTGSTDRTLEIAKEYGAKIYHFAWINDFSAARNYSLKYSTGDWILYLDADERLSPKSIEEVRRIISRKTDEAYQCSVNSIDEVNHVPHFISYPRLFRNNPKLEFTGRVHEQIIPSLQKLNYKFKNSGIEIIHLGYNVATDIIKEKAKRNLDLLLKDYAENKSAYGAFQIGQTYNALGDRNSAYIYFNEMVAIHDACPISYKAHAYRFMASCKLRENKFDEALKFSGEGLKIDKTQPLLNVILAKIHQKINDDKQAIYYAQKAYEYNHELVAGKSKDFDFTQDEFNLILFGLQIASIFKNKQSAGYFLSRVPLITKPKPWVKDFTETLKLILNDQPLTPGIIDEFIKWITNDNLESVLSVIENYAIPDSRLELLKQMSGKFQADPAYLNALGLAMMENNYRKQAAIVLKKSIELGYKDAASMIKLISLCVLEGDKAGAEQVLALTEAEYGSFIPEKIAIIRQKLKNF